ncbi:MAG: hypothetical protein CBC38_05875 [Gammaproteobacteria bacterium TMED78]|nr:MAG: hypothetical protein CBC38_05875 [Gammaproteobacteria bacterium TMED78]|tara:strand:+ start:1241 stop:1780 length:540 start_codon:yes stop_codon:yes gene_type:complete
MIKYIIPLIIFFTLVGFFIRGLSLNPSYVPSPLIGKNIPNYELQDLENLENTIRSSDMLGNVSLLNVWATWCIECRNEHPFLVELSETTNIPIYGLNWKDNRSDALDWLQTLGDPYVSSAYDLTGEIAIDWGVYAAPETFLIGSDGIILYKHIAALTPEVWTKEFVPRILNDCRNEFCL